MAIKKQEFYEGAALHQIIRAGVGSRIKYDAPFFVVDEDLRLYLKYSTAIRSPWKFTFSPEEQKLLYEFPSRGEIVIGLICSDDGVVALTSENYQSIALQSDLAVSISCYRSHKEHYEVNGPDSSLVGKIPPANWQRLLANK